MQIEPITHSVIYFPPWEALRCQVPGGLPRSPRGGFSDGLSQSVQTQPRLFPGGTLPGTQLSTDVHRAVSECLPEQGEAGPWGPRRTSVPDLRWESPLGLAVHRAEC